jgi:hypothetical protein
MQQLLLDVLLNMTMPTTEATHDMSHCYMFVPLKQRLLGRHFTTDTDAEHEVRVTIIYFTCHVHVLWYDSWTQNFWRR